MLAGLSTGGIPATSRGVAREENPVEGLVASCRVKINNCYFPLPTWPVTRSYREARCFLEWNVSAVPSNRVLSTVCHCFVDKHLHAWVLSPFLPPRSAELPLAFFFFNKWGQPHLFKSLQGNMEVTVLSCIPPSFLLSSTALYGGEHRALAWR